MVNSAKLDVLICPVCGGTEFQSNGNGTYKCRCCNAVLRDGSKSAKLFDDAKVVFDFLDASNFEAAEEICRNRLNYSPDNAELHWLLFLARNKIKFVVDPLTEERKPVFYSDKIFTRDCVLEDEDFLAALHGDNADRYRETAQKIENVRCELCENLVKNPAFEKVDVFISFKNNETLIDVDGNKIEKPTEDSIIAKQVYEALSKLGYKVFFSPISIGRGNVLGEKYEPKIFAALASCKAMVLIGTKSSYVNSTWVRNEWSRYIFFMEHCPTSSRTTLGKEENTLFYMYGNVLPKGLPSQIAERQGISCGTNNPKYIEILCQQISQKVTPAENKSRIYVAPTKNVGGKVKTISDNVVKRAVATAEDSSLTLNDDRKLKAANGALGGGDYNTAEKYACDILADKPHNSNALLVGLLAKCKVQKVDMLAENDGLIADYQLLCDNILYGEPETSKRLVEMLTKRMVIALSNTHEYTAVLKWLDLPVGHEFDGRKQMFDALLDAAYKTDFGVRSGSPLPHEAVCNKLLKCFDQDEVAPYITACKKFAEQLIAARMFDYARKMYNKASAADPSDPESKWLALWCSGKYSMLGDELYDVEVFTPKAMEEILGCCETTEAQFDYIARAVDVVIINAKKVVKMNSVDDMVDVKKIKQYKEIIKNQLELTAKTLDDVTQYVAKDNDEWLANKLSRVADICRSGGEFVLAETYYKRALALESPTSEMYWGLLLAELSCKNDNQLKDVDTHVDTVEKGDLYANVLAAASSDGTIDRYIRAKKQQADAIRMRDESKAVARSKRKKKTVIALIVAVAVVLVVVGAALLFYFIPQFQLSDAIADGGYVDCTKRLSCVAEYGVVAECEQVLTSGVKIL